MTGFLERSSISVMEVLIFILTMSLASAKSFGVSWRSDLKDESKTKLSARSNQVKLHLLIWHSAEFVHAVQVNHKKKSSDKTLPCRRPTST